jgi:DNA-binding NarL/FixJ family response regulator
LHGRDDAGIPFEEGRTLAALIPDARFVPLDSRNHILLENEPAWQRFLAEVSAFLGVAADPVPADDRHAAFAELTAREFDILRLMARGDSNDAIANHLVITPKTVRNHISHIYSKLQTNSRTQAVIRAREAGLDQDSR